MAINGNGYVGDYAVGTTSVRVKFMNVDANGAGFALSSSPAVAVYKDGNTTESTSGVTLTSGFDSRTGLYDVVVDTSADGTFYSAGSTFHVFLTAGTSGAISMVGQPVGSFTLNKDSALKPTTAGRTLDVTATGAAGIDWANVENPTTTLNLSGTSTKALEPTTAGRTLDVTATGEAGIDWANVGSPTTTLALTGTTIATTQKVDLETIKTRSVTCAAGVTVLASVGTAATDTAQTGDSYARLGAPVAASISADIAAVKTLANDTNLSVGAARRQLATTGAAGSITLDAFAPTTNDLYNGCVVRLYSGTGAGQARLITDYDGATLTATVSPDWAVTPDATSAYAILPVGPADLRAWAGSVPNPLISGRVDADAAAVAVTLTSGERDAVAAALLDLSNGVETSVTVRQALRLMAAALGGVLSGAATTTVTVKAAANSGTTRVTATVDSNGNRSALTLNL